MRLNGVLVLHASVSPVFGEKEMNGLNPFQSVARVSAIQDKPLSIWYQGQSLLDQNPKFWQNNNNCINTELCWVGAQQRRVFSGNQTKAVPQHPPRAERRRQIGIRKIGMQLRIPENGGDARVDLLCGPAKFVSDMNRK